MQPFPARRFLHARANPHPRPGCHGSPAIRARPAGLAALRRPRSSARPRQGRCALSARTAFTPPLACCKSAARPHPIHPCPCLRKARSPPACPNLPQLKRFCGVHCTGMAIIFFERVSGLALCSVQLASGVVRLLASRLGGLL